MDQDEVQFAKTSWWRLLLQRKFRLKSRTPMPKNGEGEGAGVKEPARGFWANEAESVLSLLGLAVGLGNIWRFPWMVAINGGGAFLIPYFFMLLFCGIPLFLIELIVGQYSGAGPGNVFELSPIFKGLGWCVLANSFVNGAYYITVITWAFYYLFSSFVSPLPWSHCEQTWNSLGCFSKDAEEKCLSDQNNTIYVNHQCVINSTQNWQTYGQHISAAEEFFNRKMYSIYTEDNIQRGMTNTGPPKWDLTLTLLLAWIVTYLCICKGIKSSGKVVYFTALFPYLAITGLLIVAAQLPGAADGINFYLAPPANMSTLAHPKIWVDATTQIFYSLGLSGGSVMTYASYNRYNNNVLRDCLIVGIGNSLTSFFAGFPVFCVAGYMAQRMGTDIRNVVKSGSALVFIVYPEVLDQLPAAAFWSFLLFLMLISLGLDSQFGILETILTAILDKKPKLLPKKPFVALAICSCMFVIGFSTVSMAGVYWVELLSYYSGFATVVLALINSLVYCWIYGAGRLIDHLQHMINRKFPITLVWILMFLWKVLAPVIIVIIFVFNFIHVSKIDYHGYVLPDWAQAFGWLLVWVPLIMVPIAAIFTVKADRRANPYSAESLLQRMLRLTKPSARWKPSYLKHEQTITNIAVNESNVNGSVSHIAPISDSSIGELPTYGTNADPISLPDITRQDSKTET
ncbi:sodium-dependent proline transporter-like [Watersipora subatra]|uniref:sodium-dependent proline transporter-like n=1 Tax=Watersipora subatra TaxID=2589382 RepID=UPI00355C8C49